MTVEELEALELPVDSSPETALYCDSAIDWLIENTILEIDKGNLQETVKALPSGAKLFICKYFEIMSIGGTGVASESIGGMSQSFTNENKNVLLWQQAKDLIGIKYLKGQVKSIPNVSKWA